MIESIKKHWATVLSVIAAIVGFIVFRDKLQEGLKAKLKNADVGSKDAVLEERKSGIKRDRALEEARAADLRNQLNKGVSQSDQDTINFYKKK
jgi:hypothetical protein